MSTLDIFGFALLVIIAAFTGFWGTASVLGAYHRVGRISILHPQWEFRVGAMLLGWAAGSGGMAFAVAHDDHNFSYLDVLIFLYIALTTIGAFWAWVERRLANHTRVVPPFPNPDHPE